MRLFKLLYRLQSKWRRSRFSGHGRTVTSYGATHEGLRYYLIIERPNPEVKFSVQGDDGIIADILSAVVHPNFRKDSL